MDESDSSTRHVTSADHTVVFRDEESFAAWPFNGGMWKVDGDDVLVAFIRHSCDYSVEEDLHDTQVVRYGSVVSPTENKQDQLSHARVETYGELVSMRTRDGGETWEDAGIISDNVRTSERVLYEPIPTVSAHDLTDPQVLLACWSAPNSAASNAVPWIKLSTDGGHDWSAPIRLPMFNFQRIQGRPSYLVRPDGTILLMLTGKGQSDAHDVPIVYASFDGGQNWTFLSTIAQSDRYRMLCPSPVLMDDGSIVAAVRCKMSVHAAWTEIYRSTDGGRTWSFRCRMNDSGAPGQLLSLEDETLLCVYGYRQSPYGIRARVSHDRGDSWGKEWILRDDGANYDLGYPRAVDLGNDSILVTYYFNQKDADIAVSGGPRYIASTKFDSKELTQH